MSEDTDKLTLESKIDEVISARKAKKKMLEDFENVKTFCSKKHSSKDMSKEQEAADDRSSLFEKPW